MPMPHDLHPLCECAICLDSRSGRSAALAKSAGAPSVTFKHVGSFLLAAQPMLVEIGEFLDASLEQNADQRATLAWDFSDGSRTIAKIVVSRTGQASAVAKSFAGSADTAPGETDADPEWRKQLFHGLRTLLEQGARANVEQAATALDEIRDALRQHLIAARHEAAAGFGGKVDAAAAFTAAQQADAVAKAERCNANAAKVAELAKQAPRHVPFSWPTDIGPGARKEALEQLVKTSTELQIADLGEAVRHDERRERILKALDHDLAELPDQERRHAVQPAARLGLRGDDAARHDERRHELIAKHSGAR